jgi:aryl-alcohol dehydrogenase-like predicted oxidoreductase
MELRNVGRSGLVVSAVGLGCNNFGGRIGPEQSKLVVQAALDEGITFFDTADIYGNLGGSEQILGEALEGRRDQVVIATKFGGDMGTGEVARGSRRYVTRALEASLRRLRTDWIDLYYLHFFDPRTPIEETLAALDDAVRAGKVRYIGCSNLPVWQVVEAEFTARDRGNSRFVAAQYHYNLLERSVEQELLPACRRYGIGFVPYYPLAAGLLTGKYRRGEPPPEGARLAARPEARSDARLAAVEAYGKLAADAGVELLELAIGWLLAQEGVASVIAGATSAEQVRANVRAAAFRPTQEVLEAIDRTALELAG